MKLEAGRNTHLSPPTGSGFVHFNHCEATKFVFLEIAALAKKDS